MKHATLITRLLATTALALLAATAAQASSSTSAATTSSAQVESLPRSTVQAKRIDGVLLPGNYLMNNGMRLVISGSEIHLRAALDGAGSRRLLATDTPNVYKSRDGLLEVEFLARTSSESPDVHLTLLRPAAATTAQAGSSEALKLSRAD
jgi:hypothetical protein